MKILKGDQVMNKLLIVVLAVSLSTCKARKQSKLKDGFLESATGGNHEVVYLEGANVYRVTCGDEFNNTTEVLSRKQCSHTNPKLKSEFLDYEIDYKPRLMAFFKLQTPDTIKNDLVRFKTLLEKLTKAYIDESVKNADNPNYRSEFPDKIKVIEEKIALLEPQEPKLALYEAIVGSADGKTKGLLDVTQQFQDFAISLDSKNIIVPFTELGSGVSSETNEFGMVFVKIDKDSEMQTTEVTQRQWEAV